MIKNVNTKSMIIGNSPMKRRELKKTLIIIMIIVIRGTSNLLDETIYSIVVFKINVFFELLKEELPNNSTSENLESFRF